MVTHVLYIYTASMAERGVTCGHTGTFAGGSIPGRGSVGALEPALLFSPHSDPGLRTIPPSLSLVSLPAELKDRVCCFLCLGSHLDTTALLWIFMYTKWPQPQGSRTLPGEICMEQKSKPSATQKNSGVETPRYHYEKELGAKRYAKCPWVEAPCMGSVEAGFPELCLQEAVHVGVCARGHSGHPVPTTDSRYKLMGSVGSLVAGYLVLMPKTNFK